MWKLPAKVILVSGTGHGASQLNAFDNALRNAGIGDYNLIKVTSIVPGGATIVTPKEYRIELAPGSILPAVYTYRIGASREDRIASCVGVGVPNDTHKVGVIFEANLIGTESEAQKMVSRMLTEAMECRGTPIGKQLMTSADVIATHSYACTISAAVLLP